MIYLIIGLILFLGTHSARIFAEDSRQRLIAEGGLLKFKIAYAIVSIIGLALIVWGYGQTRFDPVYLWFPPIWTKHLAALLTLPAFVLLIAAYLPASKIKAMIGHPMTAGVKLWALSHVLSNGTLADVLLFGSFLAWSIAAFSSARKRDRAEAKTPVAGKWANDAIAVIAGVVVWFVFARYLHAMLFGIAPLG